MPMQTRRARPVRSRRSVIGLGCNNFGGRSDAAQSAASSTPRSTRASISSTPPTSIPTRARRRSSARCWKAGATRVVLATKFGAADRRRPRRQPRQARLYPEAGRGVARPPQDRPHRPLPDARAGSVDADRGDAGRARRGGRGRQDPLLRRSHFTPEGLAEAQARGAESAASPASWRSQDELSLVERGIETTLLPVIEKEGLALIPYFPLAGGLLSGKYRGGERPDASRLSTGSLLLATRYSDGCQRSAGRAPRRLCRGEGARNRRSRLRLAAGA